MKSIQELSNMKGKVSLITGGGGHIGKAIAETVAELGSDVLLIDLEAAVDSDFSQRLATEYGTRIDWLASDLTKKDTISEIVDHLNATGTPLDVLINNAAFVGTSDLQGWSTDFENQSVESWNKAMNVNSTSIFTLTQACTPLLRQSSSASIINISSIYGMLGPDLRIYKDTNMGNPAAYAMSKGGVIQFTRWLSTVLAPTIRVNCISPGGVKRNQAESFQEAYCQKTPLQRMATEEDFKGAVAFLASNLSTYVTGHNLVVDGGWSAW